VGTNPEYHMPNGVPAYPVDLAIALDHMTLIAVDEGLGTCWIGGFSQEIAKEVLNVPDGYTIAALLTLGFPKTIPDSKPRKTFEDTVCHESFRE
jgi:nitroreductase